VELPAYKPNQAPSHYNPFLATKQDLGSKEVNDDGVGTVTI